LQILFLHVYLFSKYLPINFRDSISGLQILENLNFLPTKSTLSPQNILIENLIKDSPMKFQMFDTDINFTLAFTPILMLNIFFILWFMFLFIAKRFIYRKNSFQQRDLMQIHEKILYDIVHRKINYFDQIWRMQFLCTIWICLLQFYNFQYPQYTDKDETVNTILCLSAFFFSFLWFAFVIYYSGKKYYEVEY
jgi:hypothetical protein